LSLKEIEQISRSFGDLLWLAFSGGEIFLRDDLVEIARTFYRNNRPSIILLSTNGILSDTIASATEEILKKCPKSTIVVKLSLDGSEELHDAMRGVKGTFRNTIATLDVLGTLKKQYDNLEVGINTLFCSSNQDTMDSILKFVQGLDNINTHTVSLIRGEVKDQNLKIVDIDKYNETVDRMASDLRNKKSDIYTFRGARLKAAQDILQRRLIRETFVQGKRLTPCYAGKLNLVITETGDVYPCESFAHKMGNVRESGYDIRKVLNSQEAGKIIKAIKKNNCFCTHECYMMTNILFNPSHYPALLKEYLRL